MFQHFNFDNRLSLFDYNFTQDAVHASELSGRAGGFSEDSTDVPLANVIALSHATIDACRSDGARVEHYVRLPAVRFRT